MSYKVTEKVNIDEQGKSLKEYGIMSSDGINLEDITDDYNEISKLVASLNENEIPPCHLKDIVEDFLCEKHTVTALRK